MKKILIISAFAAAAFAFTACNNSALQLENAEGSISVNFSLPQATRADSQGKEATLTDVQMLIFNSDEELYKYYQLSSAEVTAKTATLANVVAGDYSVYVIANGPDLSDCTELDGLLETDIDLPGYNDPSADFVMEGHDDVTVTGGSTADATIALSRYVSRVVLKKVINQLPEAYGAFTLTRAFLANAVSMQNLGENRDIEGEDCWYNKEGRYDEETRDEDHIIDGTTYAASGADLTFAAIGQSINNGANYSTAKYFYAYPNSSTTDPVGFSSTFYGQKTVLVIVGAFNGHTYYYPVVMNALARNTSYEVTATITGAGAEDPSTPVSSGSITLTVTVNNWLDGTSYTETF